MDAGWKTILLALVQVFTLTIHRSYAPLTLKSLKSEEGGTHYHKRPSPDMSEQTDKTLIINA